MSQSPNSEVDKSAKKKQIIAELNQETSKIAWSEMQKFFASGSTIFVDESLDLLDVASSLVMDEKSRIEQLMNDKLMHNVTDEQATRWLAVDQMMWAVVLAPYVLVQTVKVKD